jgi:hypothetical protein
VQTSGRLKRYKPLSTTTSGKHGFAVHTAETAMKLHQTVDMHQPAFTISSLLYRFYVKSSMSLKSLKKHQNSDSYRKEAMILIIGKTWNFGLTGPGIRAPAEF